MNIIFLIIYLFVLNVPLNIYSSCFLPDEYMLQPNLLIMRKKERKISIMNQKKMAFALHILVSYKIFKIMKK